jgi:DNA-directed RNA polymerase specialized sigma24 family protein
MESSMGNAGFQKKFPSGWNQSPNNALSVLGTTGYADPGCVVFGGGIGMSLATEIAPHLPYLRRFARSLCGNQDSGDAYVVHALEAIIADPSSFPTDVDPKIGIYKTFVRIWNSIHVNTDKDALTAGGPVALSDRRLDAITPRPRQAFLLVSVEGFKPEEAAEVLGCSVAELKGLIDEAGREIAAQVATDVLIIEDEPIIAMDLEALVEGLGHRVCHVARTHREALAAVRKTRPGMILADIQLADGSSGLEAVNEILTSFQVPVIFITAYPERLLTGVRPEPTFLIAKPFHPDTVKATISQALFFDTKAVLEEKQGKVA